MHKEEKIYFKVNPNNNFFLIYAKNLNLWCVAKNLDPLLVTGKKKTWGYFSKNVTEDSETPFEKFVNPLNCLIGYLSRFEYYPQKNQFWFEIFFKKLDFRHLL